MSEIANAVFPYDTEKECKDEFTRNFRNKFIDLLRKAYDMGMERAEKELIKASIEGTICKDEYAEEAPFYYTASKNFDLQDLMMIGDKVKIVILSNNK